MSWLNTIITNTGSTLQNIQDQVTNAVTNITSDPVVGALVPSLPFPILQPAQLIPDLRDLAIGLATAGPGAAALAASYFQALESEATGRLKPLPDLVRVRLQPYYDGIDLGNIYYAEHISDWFSSDAMTVDKHIYFKGGCDFTRNPGDFRTLIHELQHCVQYERMGGHSQFLLRYLSEGAIQVGLTPILWLNSTVNLMANGTFQMHSIHDSMGLEREAIDKADTLSGIFLNEVEHDRYQFKPDFFTYKQFSLKTGTALHEVGSDNRFVFLMAPNNDIYAILKNGTSTNSTEVHVLAAASNYQQFSLRTGTALHEVGSDNRFVFLMAPNNDIYAILKNGTSTNSTEVHVLAAASNYQQFSLRTGTALHEVGSDNRFVFLMAPNNDIYAILKNGTSTNSTEVHVLAAASNYQQFSLRTGTALAEVGSDNQTVFLLAPNLDIYAILKNGTSTNSTEVHVLTAASNYQQRGLETATALHIVGTDDRFVFLLAPNLDIYAILKNGTGTNSTEVHVLRW